MTRYWFARVTITPDNPDEDRDRQEVRFWSTAAPYSMELIRDACEAFDQADIYDEIDPDDLTGDGDDACHVETFADYHHYHWQIRPCLTPEQIAARDRAGYEPPNQTPRSLAARGIESPPDLFS